MTFNYPLQGVPALKEINLSITSGEFIIICGKSGCGKSTLLRHLKPVLTPHGKRTGEINFDNINLDKLSEKDQASKIGFVFQNPDNQIVTDKVWHELAFGLESLGMDNDTIRLRVAEMASFFGIQEWFMKNVSELSGGQKQLLNLASIMTMQPEVLVLDEPTSQLDPIATREFLDTIKRINRELGITIIMSEHHLEEVFEIADRVIVMDNGEIIADDSPKRIGESLSEINHEMFKAMPTAIKISNKLGVSKENPVTVREGAKWLSNNFSRNDITFKTLEVKEKEIEDEPVIKLDNVWFKYNKEGKNIIKSLEVEVKKGEFFCILGGNGTGKTTTLSIISGFLKPYRGKVYIGGKDINKISQKELFNKNLGVLPQDPQLIFVKKTVRLDLYEMLTEFKISKDEKLERVMKVAKLVEIDNLLDMHPYDLSGGEQQRAALAKILLLEPKVILLDEPTKGLDNVFKEKLYKILKKLINNGATVVMVSHDIEFCAEYADRCALFFDGSIVTCNNRNKFFTGNNFYTTAANRMSRHLFNNAITCEDVINLCKMNWKAQS